MDSLAHQQRNHFDKCSSSPFLFASPDGKAPSTARKVHLRRLRDILHLSIQRGDLLLARRTFGLLARCSEIEWMVIWKIGLVILATDSPPGSILGTTTKHTEFIRVMMLQHPEEVRSVLPSHRVSGFSTPSLLQPHAYPPTESVRLTAPARYSANRWYRSWCYPLRWRDGSAMPLMNLSCADPCILLSLHTIQLKQCSYLPSPPYQDNSVLHTYAGLLCLRLALSAETDLSPGAEGTCKRFRNLS